MKKISLFISVLALSMLSADIFATITSITGVTMTPASPMPGQSVQVQWTYTTDQSGDNPFGYVVISDTTSIRNVNTTGQWLVIGNGCSTPANPVTDVANTGCQVGSGVNGTVTSPLYTFTLPADLQSGVPYYILVGMGTWWCQLNPGPQNTQSTGVSASFTLPLPPPMGSITKTAEAAVVQPNDLVLFKIDYTYVNATNFAISDVVPANCTLEQMSQGGTSSGSSLTWNTSSVPGAMKTGSVWFTARVNTGVAPATVISNTAHWSMTEIPAGGDSNAASVTVGQPFSIIKSQNVSTAAIGDTVTYSFDVTAGASAFWSMDNFDTSLSGFTTVGSGPGFSWQSDGAGGGRIYSGAQCCVQYPHLLRTDLPDFCFGDVQGDIYIINSGSDNDGLIVLRDNGLPGTSGIAYGFGISPDGFDGNTAHSLWIQKCGSGACTNPAYTAISVAADKWYTMKIHVTHVSGGIRFQVKAWARGTTEPASYQLDYSDLSATQYGCGYVGFQAHANNGNYYDNLKITKTTMSYPVLYDTLPAELTFVDGTAADSTHSAPVLTGNTVKWDIFTTFVDNLYHFDLWAVVNNCGVLINKGSIDTVEAAPVDSNQVSINALCPESPTVTPTHTITETSTLTYTPTMTFTTTITLTHTLTPTFTQTLTLTATPTPTTPLELTPVTNYPNPFGSSGKATTTIVFDLTADADCIITVFTLSGETIFKSETFAGYRGRNTYVWDGKNSAGKNAGSGVYFYKINAQKGTEKKMAICRLAVLR